MDLNCSECDVISLYFLCCSVNGSVCLVCCVFVNRLVKQFVMCLGVVAVLLLNAMDMFSVGGGALLYRQWMVFHMMCMRSQCASNCSVHMFCVCLVCWKLCPHLRA